MRIHRYLLVSLALVLAGCGAPEQTPATDASTTTTSVPSTTTSAPTTTSTAAATTTTTTVPAPEGDALVVSWYYVLGWWADGAWQQDAEYRPLESGAEFQIFSVDEDPYSVMGGDPEVACDWSSDSIRHVPLPFELTDATDLPIGISAPWAVESGEVEHVEADQSLVEVAMDLLAAVGIEESNPMFAQVIETDLDGDGIAETLAVLDHDAGAFGVDEGAYGIAFIVHENSDVQIVGEYDVYMDDPEAAHIVAQYRFLAIMDVNNDGTDEVAMRWASFESGGENLYAVDSETSHLTRVLGQGCGV